jgi:two-component system sensor histidine kinase AtoS
MFFDYELLENVLLNLSFNSIKAIGETGVVKFKTSFDPAHKRLLIAVEDNGSGVQDEVGKEIFKPFYTTHTKGTGLGLAISRDIVEKHKGRIWYCNNKGAGCTFYISLPVVQHPIPPERVLNKL